MIPSDNMLKYKRSDMGDPKCVILGTDTISMRLYSLSWSVPKNLLLFWIFKCRL